MREDGSTIFVINTSKESKYRKVQIRSEIYNEGSSVK